MEVKLIFVSGNKSNQDGLYSMKYSHTNMTEYARIQDYWHNYSVLETFFSNNVEDLKTDYWGAIKITEAISSTMEEADRFDYTLHTCCNDSGCDLQFIFQPLYNSEYQLTPLQKSKGKIRRSWLRLYALRLDNDCFIVTGGSIKLTPDMRPIHLQEELRKLERAKVFLQSKDVYDTEDLNSIL
ncbi:MAG: hypothetical protein J7623_02135 [Chitinophaga sp.]|uniref:hypothetical protein n=1 Tax=Chitinophaga sp. TaxID=1869181 RepID=UPI001B20E8DA|nr:hypothetical protein [Chitinophaga sp.]MBO9727417.1 hypothetical protein [Chitinophaga sp.]